VGQEAATSEQLLQGRSESEELSFYAEESAQFLDEEICAGGRKEGRSNLLAFGNSNTSGSSLNRSDPFGVFHNKGNRSLRDHKTKPPFQIPLACGHFYLPPFFEPKTIAYRPNVICKE
jgi:hypothetical protein